MYLLIKQGPANVARARKQCLDKFLYYFKNGYQGRKFIAWEKEYKETAHRNFQAHLNKKDFKLLLEKGKFDQAASLAVKAESKTNLLFSFEKMAIRDAIRIADGAELFSKGLYALLYGKASQEERFHAFIECIGSLPRKQTRVLTWPLTTVFGFIGDPDAFIFLKPRVTQAAASKYKFDFNYKSKPNWETYQSLVEFAELIRKDTAKYKPENYIDLQSFIWVLGSDEYPD
jgi:hypothetical protein